MWPQGFDLCLPWQIPSLGTVTELIGAVRASKDADWLTLLSSSSGESEDTALADIGVGSGVNCVRIGPVFGAQHTAKYNRVCPACHRARTLEYRMLLCLAYGTATVPVCRCAAVEAAQ